MSSETTAPLDGFVSARSQPDVGAAAFAMALAVAFGVLAFRSLASGPWMDEIFSLYASDPRRSLGALWAEVLIQDNHPPLFNLLAWALRRVVGFDLAGGRALNLIGLAGLLLYWLSCWRRWPGERHVLRVFLVLFLCSTAFQAHWSDFRAYANVLTAGAVLALSAYGVVQRSAGPSDSRDPVVFTVAVFFAANLHYVSLLLAFFTVAGVLIVLAAQRRWRSALVLALLTAAAASPAVVFALVQERVLADRAGGVFWIEPTSLTEAVKITVRAIASQAGFNVVAVGLALFALARLLRAPHPRAVIGAVGPGVLVLMGACGGLLTALLLVNLHTPIINPRYLSIQTGFACLLIAVLAARAASGRAWLLAAVSVNAVLISMADGVKSRTEAPRWRGDAEVVAAASKACSPRPVYALLAPGSDAEARRVAGMPSDDVLIVGYKFLADRYGFDVKPVDGAEPTPLDPRCGAVFWFEHFGPKDPVTPADWFSYYGLPLPPGPISVHRGSTGAVLVAEPLRAGPSS